MEATATYTLANVISDISTWIASAVDWMSDIFTVFYDNPIAMLTLFVFITGSVIGLCSRIFRLL